MYGQEYFNENFKPQSTILTHSFFLQIKLVRVSGFKLLVQLGREKNLPVETMLYQ